VLLYTTLRIWLIDVMIGRVVLRGLLRGDCTRVVISEHEP
jgi:hypothetical protein